MNDKISESEEIDRFYRKCFVFVLDIIEYSELLKKNKNNIIAEQILKIGTTFGETTNKLKYIDANINVEKILIKIIKHIEKIKYWLYLCKYSPKYSTPDQLIFDLQELTDLLTKIKKKWN